MIHLLFVTNKYFKRDIHLIGSAFSLFVPDLNAGMSSSRSNMSYGKYALYDNCLHKQFTNRSKEGIKHV